MRLLILLLYIFIEALLLATLGDMLGAGPVLLLIVGTAALGVIVIRRHGLRTLRAVQAAQARGELPAIDLLASLLVFVGGVLLILPGPLSDVLGLLLLLGPARRRLAAQVDLNMQKRHPNLRRPMVFEGEFREMGGGRNEASNDADGGRILPDRER